MTLSGIPRERLLAAAADPRNAGAREALERAAGAPRTLTTRERENGAQGVTQRVGEAVSLVLPLPPSVNSYWRSVPASRGRIARVLISERGRAFKRRCQLAASAQCASSLTGDLSVSCVVYFADRRRDLDNVLKPLLDALQGCVYANDRQIVHLELWKRLDSKNPRVELTVKHFDFRDS